MGVSSSGNLLLGLLVQLLVLLPLLLQPLLLQHLPRLLQALLLHLRQRLWVALLLGHRKGVQPLQVDVVMVKCCVGRKVLPRMAKSSLLEPALELVSPGMTLVSRLLPLVLLVLAGVTWPMVNLISSLLEELPLAVGSEEIARVPSTLSSEDSSKEEKDNKEGPGKSSHLSLVESRRGTGRAERRRPSPH